MRCNIDSKGKAIRFIGGLAILVVAGILAGLLLLSIIGPTWVWLIVAGLGLMGSFAVFEARAGWCAARAMGFKTRW